MCAVHGVGGVFSPLDQELELLPGAYTPQVYARFTQLGAWLPFETAAELARQLLGVKVSKASVVRAAEAVGAACVALQTEAVAALVRSRWW
jgi:dihydroorotate dehydrogenase